MQIMQKYHSFLFRVTKGEKSKGKKEQRRMTNLPKTDEDLREVTKGNFILITRKLSGNIARKI